MPGRAARAAAARRNGGRTLLSICRAVGASRLDVDGETSPGIPHSRINGGRWTGTRVLSKSGGFGSPDWLSVILRDQNRNVIISSGMCLVLCGVFFASSFACKMMGDKELLAPALAAWLPVLCFGPFAVAMFDAVQT